LRAEAAETEAALAMFRELARTDAASGEDRRRARLHARK
jgi:hypothetical protein